MLFAEVPETGSLEYWGNWGFAALCLFVLAGAVWRALTYMADQLFSRKPGAEGWVTVFMQRLLAYFDKADRQSEAMVQHNAQQVTIGARTATCLEKIADGIDYAQRRDRKTHRAIGHMANAANFITDHPEAKAELQKALAALDEE